MPKIKFLGPEAYVYIVGKESYNGQQEADVSKKVADQFIAQGDAELVGKKSEAGNGEGQSTPAKKEG